MAEVFVSYKSDERNRVQALVHALRAQRLEVWWDQDIAPDAPWELTIQRELDAAKVVVVAWSNAAVASENVVAEARRARGQGKLIQVFLDERCEPPLFFGERQGVNLSGWRGEESDHRFQAVAAAARAVVSGDKPPVGVGFAPTRRRRALEIGGAALAAAAAAIGIIANVGGARDTLCSIGPLKPLCQRWGLAAAPPAPPPDPATVIATAQRRLVQEIGGVWCRKNDAVDDPFTLRTDSDAQGQFHITLTYRDRRPSSGDVDSIDTVKGVVSSHNSTPPHDEQQFLPSSSQLVITDKDGVSTSYVRCTPLPRSGR